MSAKLKEYIKSVIRKELEEESTSGAIGVGAGPIMTPYAFSKKGQKTNKATKEAEKLGFKKVSTSMHSDSKIMDYKSIWGKKKTRKIYNESDYDKPSPSSNPSLYLQASGYTGVGGDNHVNQYYKESMIDEEEKKKERRFVSHKSGTQADINTSLYETLDKIVKEELLKEVSYNQFKNEVKFRSKSEQLHKALKEVNRKLNEIDRLVEYTTRMKQELSEGDGVSYWNKTQKSLSNISEMMENLNSKIQSLK